MLSLFPLCRRTAGEPDCTKGRSHGIVHRHSAAAQSVAIVHPSLIRRKWGLWLPTDMVPSMAAVVHIQVSSRATIVPDKAAAS